MRPPEFWSDPESGRTYNLDDAKERGEVRRVLLKEVLRGLRSQAALDQCLSPQEPSRSSEGQHGHDQADLQASGSDSPQNWETASFDSLLCYSIGENAEGTSETHAAGGPEKGHGGPCAVAEGSGRGCDAQTQDEGNEGNEGPPKTLVITGVIIDALDQALFDSGCLSGDSCEHVIPRDVLAASLALSMEAGGFLPILLY